MQIFDSHTHSFHSVGADHTVFKMCEAALERGLYGFCVTDHCSVCGTYLPDSKTEDEDLKRNRECMEKSIADVRMAQEMYKGKLLLTMGIELGEPMFNPEKAKEMLGLTDYDFVLLSTHIIRKHSRLFKIDFSVKSEQEIKEFLDDYYLEELQGLKCTDFDAPSHLTFPLRRIEGECKRTAPYSAYADMMDEILKYIIHSGKGIELNLSGVNGVGAYKKPMPDTHIIKRYKELGGEIVTVGSDTHSCAFIGSGFDYAFCLLKECGFKYYAYYTNRMPNYVKLDS
jgi:histidinol-phosphatase (PHP family)